MKTKQTAAVDWLESEFIKLEQTIGVHGIMYELIEQAKEIEREQIADAFYSGYEDRDLFQHGHDYYDKMYGK